MMTHHHHYLPIPLHNLADALHFIGRLLQCVESIIMDRLIEAFDLLPLLYELSSIECVSAHGLDSRIATFHLSMMMVGMVKKCALEKVATGFIVRNAHKTEISMFGTHMPSGSRVCKWKSTFNMMQKTIVTKKSGKPDPMRRTSSTSKPSVAMVEEQKKRREEEKVENLLQLICWGPHLN
ncbi:hypothetical protein QJS10_CPA01g01110 [Acorus calamus]|uniref:Uncharacterized protein n=1 Tax=Acorus calamus TaxID=4465 RepID=A0AAV9FHA1_ACOCL|nr:hypothetical protein QJS10_CPA01g01110 [Acorus calamus]